jgi:CheY-like chemotaxis protein
MKPDTVTPTPRSESERGIVAVMQILIVEDHQGSREQLNGCLTRRGYTVAAAGDLETGIDFLGKQSFDAIIADIVLPDGTGYALISEVRQRGIHTCASPFRATPIHPTSKSQARLGSIIIYRSQSIATVSVLFSTGATRGRRHN